MKTLVKLMVLFLLSLGSRKSFSQGKIDRSKQEIKNGNKRESHQTVQSGQHSTSTQDRSLGNLLFGGVLDGLAYATWYSLIGYYKWEAHLHSNITKYPYYNNYSGN